MLLLLMIHTATTCHHRLHDARYSIWPNQPGVITGDLRRSTHTYSHYKQQLQVTSKQDATSTSSTVAVETRKPNLPCFQTDLPPSESSPEVAKTHTAKY